MRNRRLATGLDQARVANLLGTGKDTVYLWENNRAKPTFPFLPKIIEFLEYCPYAPDWTSGERLTWIRKYSGLSQEALAQRLGVDPGTMANWEREMRRVSGEC